ncbi:MAG: hypothetical protein COX07_08345 [Bacteroidetes bacterium CG23_combo_of_CG06-09_8_20_14_all_32_9]|nr:MAG: hypothetical protein COX07_08345 [Bacteroidetes bacterium CG23_combo_of_CG06-09_8_20_14_all_32_9]
MESQKILHNECIAQKVVNTAFQFPENNALYINDTFYSYKQLLEIVNVVYLQIPNNKDYSRIGIYCNDDVYSYASIVAVNLYGAAYVPLNKRFPLSRNKWIIKECALKLIVTSVMDENIEAISDGVDIINVEHSDLIFDEEAFKIKINKIRCSNRNNNSVCYILFTSGSTGVPKGVPVSNENVNSFFNYFFKHYEFNKTDKFLQVYELTFDVSVFSFFMPLMVGACCYILPDDGIKHIKIIESLQKHNITVVSMVPTVLRYIEKYLDEITLPDLRYSFFSGDALYHKLVTKWSKSLPNAKIHNFYGPTETTIVCTRYIFNEFTSAKESVNGIVPLGKVFEGMEALIVDENNKPAEKGELCFAGLQVILSYLNNADAHKFFNYKNKCFYKTGDIVSVNKFGNLVFYGRTDNQVKINGYRVELVEIENAIYTITNVNCVVVCKEDENKINQLFAFIEKNQIDENSLKEKLYSVLPVYMIPQRFVAVKKFVLNANGKVDRKKLIKIGYY